MEFAGYLRFLLALVFVIGLIGLIAVIARKYGIGFPAQALKGGRGGRRIAVVEVTALDPRRRLALIRRDDVEHLVILGTGSETVVETGIRVDPQAPPLPESRP